MRRTDLTHIYFRFERRCQQLIELLNLWPLQNTHYSVSESFGRPLVLLSRLQHLWAEFSCELIVRSAMGHCRTRTGFLLPNTPGIRRVSDIPKVSGKPIAGIKAKWEDPTFSIRYSTVLNVANSNKITQGLSSANVANLEDLKTVRNFIVHSNVHTGDKYTTMLQKHGLFRIKPDQFIREPSSVGGTMFEAWIVNLLDSAWNAVE